jgi:hypothetical protein|tara:strand:+ start:1112 stop:1813 length:702 start_codon:yes stop_codon:yes gene_type:complete
MAKTYLDIVNIVLQDANEVPVSASAFSNVRGLQAFVKESVNRSLMDIVNIGTQWEWLKAGTIQAPRAVTTVSGTQFYNFKVLAAGEEPFVDVDFDTFFISDGVNLHQPLKSISYDAWNDTYRSQDYQDDAVATPSKIIMTGEKNLFGLSPVPDKAYTVNFYAWTHSGFLSAYSDTLPFPDQYYTVLVDRARYYLWDFKENDAKAQKAKNSYQRGLMSMQQKLAPFQRTRMRAI